QLDLFSPDDGHYEYSAVATNQTLAIAPLWHFMAGRGAHEKTYAELKQHFAFAAISHERSPGEQRMAAAQRVDLEPDALDADHLGSLGPRSHLEADLRLRLSVDADRALRADPPAGSTRPAPRTPRATLRRVPNGSPAYRARRTLLETSCLTFPRTEVPARGSNYSRIRASSTPVPGSGVCASVNGLHVRSVAPRPCSCSSTDTGCPTPGCPSRSGRARGSRSAGSRPSRSPRSSPRPRRPR